jgi:hypothetical protein
MTATATNRVAKLNGEQVSNGGKPTIDMSVPYIASVTIVGTAPLLFHAWNVEAVEEKAKAAKGSKAKKSDNIESYVYRNPDGYLGIPGKNMHGTLINAGKSMQDPRSPRKSMSDMIRAGIVPLDVIAVFEPKCKTWDYEDRQRVTVQRAAITRTRPAMREGWRVTFDLLVNVPEYLNEQILTSLINNAGRLVGLCDYRPTYGRFSIAGFEVISAVD